MTSLSRYAIPDSHLRSETEASSLVSVPMIQAEKQSLSSRRIDNI